MKRFFFIIFIFGFISCQEATISDEVKEQLEIDLPKPIPFSKTDFYSTSKFKENSFTLEVRGSDGNWMGRSYSYDSLVSSIECYYDKDKDEFAVLMRSLEQYKDFIWAIQHENVPDNEEIIEEFRNTDLHFGLDEDLKPKHWPTSISTEQFSRFNKGEYECKLQYKSSDNLINGRLECQFDHDDEQEEDFEINAKFICEKPDTLLQHEQALIQDLEI